jgi:zinc transporter ZupT
MVLGTFPVVFLASSLACIVTGIGIYVINRYAEWGHRNAAYFMSFAAGVLTSVTILHVMPEAYGMNDHAPIYILVGFISLYIINRFLSAGDDHLTTAKKISIGIIPMIGIGIHSFIDGIIYTVTFNVSIFTGVLAAVGMVLHEFPEGIVTFLLLERGGFTRRKAIVWSFLAAAISTPLGTLLSYPFVVDLEDNVLGMLLSLSAGALLYVGATHLLPLVQNEQKKYTLISLIIGIIVAVVIVLSKG